MKILGVCNANDSGASLIVDGRVVASANEERFSRRKLTSDFPNAAIEYVLAEGGLTIDDIDYVGCGAWNGIDTYAALPRLLEDAVAISGQGEGAAKVVRERLNATLRSDHGAKMKFEAGIKELGVPSEKIIYCDHHVSHALTAFYPSPFEDAVVLVADGRGDFRSTTLWRASREGGLEILDSSSELASIGAMYGFVTKLLGFIPDRHEGKVTGLAAHGKPSLALQKLAEGIGFNSKTGRIEPKFGDWYKPFGSAEMPALVELLDEVPREDFAFAAQKLLEDVLRSYLVHHLANAGIETTNLCLAGGCMANVKLNYELLKLPQVKDIYVAPGMGDGGNALGGAINVSVKREGKKWIEMPTVYLGPQFSQQQIEASLNAAGIAFRTIGSSEKISLAAELINQGKIVGWFQGRMEYGPRALGSRSIMASAADPTINASLNERLNRTEFMPFAPATIDKLASRCFHEWKPEHVSPKFMTVCYTCSEWMATQCPATVHVDNTARPQIVSRPDNAEYYDVIERYAELSGRPALINTSFNHHEEPILLSPDDAVRSYRKNNVDVLIIGDCFVGLD